jgi:proteic killer suppression protein
MILNFKHKGLKELFEEGKTRNIPGGLSSRLPKLLDLIDATEDLKDLRSRRIDLRQIRKGRFRGNWGAHVAGPWWIVFKLAEGNAQNVELVMLQLPASRG